MHALQLQEGVEGMYALYPACQDAWSPVPWQGGRGEGEEALAGLQGSRWGSRVTLCLVWRGLGLQVEEHCDSMFGLEGLRAPGGGACDSVFGLEGLRAPGGGACDSVFGLDGLRGSL